MGIFPEWLYELTPRDEQVTPLEITNVFASSGPLASSNVPISAFGTVPKGKIFIVTSINASLTPGAAQFPLSWTCQLFKPGISNIGLCGGSFSGTTTAAFPLYDSKQGPFYIVEDFQFVGQSLFNAGAANNTFRLDITGVIIPRGNFAI